MANILCMGHAKLCWEQVTEYLASWQVASRRHVKAKWWSILKMATQLERAQCSYMLEGNLFSHSLDIFQSTVRLH